MRHRGLEPIRPDDLEEAIARCPADEYVIWTGHQAGVQNGSLRSRALSCIAELGAPVQLRVVMRRAAQFDAGLGYCPEAVRGAVRTHQRARPAVYLLVRRLRTGDFVAVADIPYPAGGSRPVAKGELLLSSTGQRRFDLGQSNASSATGTPQDPPGAWRLPPPPSAREPTGLEPGQGRSGA